MSDHKSLIQGGVCPNPDLPQSAVEMEHGAGGRRFQQLLDRIIKPRFAPTLQAHLDSAICTFGANRIAFTSDSYVVTPLFFPGGDIGSLAVHGTINDLAMVGATPRFLSCSMIISEGVAISLVDRVLASMQRAAQDAGISIVTGDTKVIERRHGDEIFINTSGIGAVPDGLNVGPGQIRQGDSIIVSGPVGNHGAAIMAVREGLGFQTELVSDTASLHQPVEALIASGITIHAMRDITRGGLTAGMIELAMAANMRCELLEDRIPVDSDVRSLARVLGLDPFCLASEGRFILFCPEADAVAAVQTLREFSVSRGASIIGQVLGPGSNAVMAITSLGTTRQLQLPIGMNLPRIC